MATKITHSKLKEIASKHLDVNIFTATNNGCYSGCKVVKLYFNDLNTAVMAMSQIAVNIKEFNKEFNEQVYGAQRIQTERKDYAEKFGKYSTYIGVC